ncbi:hypothetical protein [Nonomuraea endophytica]|uniref:Uncharacterized protein n=1 Tax=Nonomuraea endophytica TaxID=714136 RepID=A0A7W8EL98_9ACTN|nr:hypothetical protein [Nonomuraea endophytica]MBB5083664.1 hypothetical protein [Nonomuraea endophytica]
MSARQVVALSAAVLAVVGCSAQVSAPRPAITQTVTPQALATSPDPSPPPTLSPQPSLSPLPEATATTDTALRPRPKICGRRGEHRVPAPDVLIVSGVRVEDGRVMVEGRTSIRVCGPRVANDSYFEPVAGPAKTYRLARRATVVLLDMSDGPKPAHYGVPAYIQLLRAPEPRVERAGLDPHFRSYKFATISTSDVREITMFDQHYNP